MNDGRIMTATCRVFLLATLFVFSSCGERAEPPEERESAGGGEATGISTTTILKQVYDVEYADGVAVVEAATMASLESSADGVLRFAPEARSSLQLTPGQVVVFWQHSIGRVESVDDASSGITVRTSPALFTDAFRNADIQLEARIDWREPSTVARFWDFGLIRRAHAEQEWSISRKFELKGVSIDTKLTLKSADRLDFEINSGLSLASKMKSFTRGEAGSSTDMKSVSAHDVLDTESPLIDWTDSASSSSGSASPGGTATAVDVAKVRATGHISGFVQALQINVRDSNLEKFDFRIRDLKGEIRVEGAGLQGAAGSFDVKLPLEYVIPLVIGPVPIALKLGAAVKLTPQVHVGSAKFCFKAVYDGTSGLSFESGALKNQSSVRQKTATLCGNEETVSAGQLTVGFGATANIPEISLLIFGNTIVPSVALNYGGVTLYEPGIASAQTPCQSGNTDLQAVVKIVLSFFGTEIAGEHKLWQQRKEWKCDGSTVETSFDPINGERTESTPAGG
jgi:hypothetical protein